MQTVSHIPLTDIVKKYLSNDVTPDGGRRWKTICPFHSDTDPSLKLMEKDDGTWYYHCFVCKANGSAAKLLTNAGICQSIEEAESLLRKDFGLEFPETVTVKTFAKFKGFDEDFLKAKAGIADVGHGIKIPIYDKHHNLITNKIRTKFTGKDKYYYDQKGKNPPYGLWLLDSYDDDVIYITEGETDALTLIQAGFPAIGIPSANAWKAEYTSILERFHRITVVRDTDAAGIRLVRDIAKSFTDNTYIVLLPSEAKDVNNFHLHYCGGDIEEFKDAFKRLKLIPATPQCFIQSVARKETEITDPDSWDMLVTTLTRKSELEIFKEHFIKETGVKARTVNLLITEARQRINADRPARISEVNRCYCKLSPSGEEVAVTNFVVELLYCIKNGDDEITRAVKLLNTYGGDAVIQFTGEELTNPNLFAAKCAKAGNFHFTGDKADLDEIFKLIDAHHVDVIQSPSYIGKLPDGGWLFGNCGITKNGEYIPINEQGFVVLDSDKYLPNRLIADGEESFGGAAMPMLPDECTLSPEDIKALAMTFKESFGTYGVWLALGWLYAGWYSEEIFRKHHFYPYLFVYGKRRSGKSTLCELIMQTYGFPGTTAGISIESPTNVGVTRLLGYYSSLPQWFDDYRNDVKRIKAKDGLLLDIYNRHGSVKGTLKAGKVRSDAIRGFVLLSGEHLPDNNALLSRCVTVEVSEHERSDDMDKFKELQRLCARLPELSLMWCQRSTDKVRKTTMLNKIEEIAKLLTEKRIDSRGAINTAIFAAGFLKGFGDYLSEGEINRFLLWLCEASDDARKKTEEESPVSEFFNDCSYLVNKGKLKPGKDYRVIDGNLYIYTASFYNAWQEHRVSLKLETISRGNLASYLKKEPVTISMSNKKYFGSKECRCACFSLLKLEELYPDFFAAVTGDEDEF